MDDDYSTDLLLASLLNDNVDDDTIHASPQQVSTDQLLPSSEPIQQTSVAYPTPDSKAPHFDSLEDLLNATLSPSEENYSDLGKTSSGTNSLSVPGLTASAIPSEVVIKSPTVSSATSVGLPPKFRNTFKPVEICDTLSKQEYRETTFKSPSYVAASQASTSASINNSVLLTDVLPVTTSCENTWQQLKDKTFNDSMCPSSKRFCSEGHVSSSNAKSFPSITAVASSVTTNLSGNNVYPNVLASNTMSQSISHPIVTTSVSLNGVNSAVNSNTATNATNVDLKRLQETNLVSELQAASTKPISSASILHAIQVVQLNYSMLLQKLSQNIDDATAQEVKTKLMVLTHHYKQLAQQYQAKLSAEKTTNLSSSTSTTSVRVVTTNTTTSISSTTVTNHSINNQSSISNMSSSANTSTVIDLTHDKLVKTTPTTAVNKESCGTVTAPAVTTFQHLRNSTAVSAAASVAGANVSSYLQSIPSLAAYLLQNTEAQKQLTSTELQQLNQIRVNLLQEFQRRQVQNFLTSLPADTRPKNVNELKDMMKEKNFSIQIPPFLVAPVIKPSATVNTTQCKQEMKTDPLMTTGHTTDSKQVTMQAGSLSSHQQSVMATLLPHTMVNNMKSDVQPTSYQQDVKPPVLPGDSKPITATTQHQLFIGDMLQHLHNSQLAAAVAAGTTKFAQLKNENKREEIPTTSSANSQIVQGGASATQPSSNLLKNNTHRSFPNAINPPSFSRSKIMAHNITRNIPGTSFSSKAAKYRAMAANVSSVADVSALSMSSSSTFVAKPSLHQSTSNNLTHSSPVTSSSTHYNTRAQLRTQRMIEEQKRLEEERIKQLTYTPEQLKTISKADRNNLLNIKYFMQADHSRITKVDTQTPFHSRQDAFQRLSAYHVYYEPEPSEAIESRVEQMHDILARELMKKSRGLMAKYNQLVLKDEQKEVPKHIELTNERLFAEGELHKEHQQKEAIQKSTAPVLDTTAMSKLSSLNSQLIHDINVLHYTNATGSVGIT